MYDILIVQKTANISVTLLVSMLYNTTVLQDKVCNLTLFTSERKQNNEESSFDVLL